MDILQWFRDELARLEAMYDDVNAVIADINNMREGQVTPQLLPGGVGMWAGFEDLSAPRGRKLVQDAKAAGCRFVTFTPTNDATKASWVWQPARKRILAGMEYVASEGLEVIAGPWVRANLKFMEVVGQRVAGLFKDLGLEPKSEWDAEGSFEVTFKKLLAQFGGDADAAADALINIYLKQFGDRHGDLSVTLLYFNRPGGDALIRHKRILEAMIQVYSVILGGAKFGPTSQPGFQPGTLQERGWQNYDDFLNKHFLQRLSQGLGFFGERERLNHKIPVSLRLTNAKAVRKASLVTREYAHRACIWAASTLRGAHWRELALREMRFLSSGGIAETEDDARPQDHLAPVSEAVRAAVPQGVVVDWEGRRVMAGSRFPEGFRKLDNDDDPMQLIRGTAVAIGKVNHKVIRPLPGRARDDDPGTYTFFTTADGDRYVALDERHGATFRAGKQVTAKQLGMPNGIHGITVFEHRDNRKRAA